MKKRNFFIIHVAIFLLVMLFAKEKWPTVLLLVAQLVYVPVMFNRVVDEVSLFKRLFPFVAIPAYVAIGIIAIFPSKWDGLLALIYVLFTLFIASYGVVRFVHRGFTHMEEFTIDCGFIFLFVGGLWFFAYQAGIHTGFSPLITWLTAIHFHYSSFLMLVFVGLLGRLRKTGGYPALALLLIILPWVMAAGITVSRWIEIVGVSIYIVTIVYLIVYSLRTTYRKKWQSTLIRLSFGVVGVTIIFSLLYVFSNGFGMQIVTIQWMLVFHGITNACIFGLLGLIGWNLALPNERYDAPAFPLSPFRKKLQLPKGTALKEGLVEDLSVYLAHDPAATIGGEIVHFYERTTDYRLFARVYWQRWFLPFAFVYKGVSRLLEQINLPLSSREAEMVGNVYTMDEGANGRSDVRAWVRKIGEEQVFLALYSSHTDGKRTYMNIALPLPFTSMHGILALEKRGNALTLTSIPKDETMKDAGIYLVFGKHIRFRLPLTETFVVWEAEENTLLATHEMNIFGIRFLSIAYTIHKKSGKEA